MAKQEPPAEGSQNPWYGPPGQFWPHRVIWSIICAFFASVWNTIAGLVYFIFHPIKSIRGLLFVIKHPRSTLRGIMSRSHGSLRRKGIFYTVTSLVCMFVLPGGGLFGQAAELSEHGRKASTMREQEEMKRATAYNQQQQAQQADYQSQQYIGAQHASQSHAPPANTANGGVQVASV